MLTKQESEKFKKPGRLDNAGSRLEDKTDQTYTAPFDRVEEVSDSDEFERSDDEDVAGLGIFAKNTSD